MIVRKIGHTSYDITHTHTHTRAHPTNLKLEYEEYFIGHCI